MATTGLKQLFDAELRLCKLAPHETVAIIAEAGCKQAYVGAAMAAAHELGATAYAVTLDELSAPLLPPVANGNDGRAIAAVVAATEPAHFVLDVTRGGLIHSTVRMQILGKGKRMLFVAEPPAVLQRLFPSADVTRRVDQAGDLIKRGSRLRVKSEAGTDVVSDISGEIPITRQYGYTDTAGRWDHWPSGFVACFPHDGTTEGTIVLESGDVLLPFNRYVQSRTTFQIEKGFIVAIEGAGPDTVILKSYLDQWGTRDAYAISHVGWGVHPEASWSALAVYEPSTIYGQELRSVAGNYMFSTGSNRFANRETPAHLDIPMGRCSIWVDDICVAKRGVLEPSP
jgi:2,5-dihydroxypyridine 5,6-dioxygenase